MVEKAGGRFLSSIFFWTGSNWLFEPPPPRHTQKERTKFRCVCLFLCKNALFSVFQLVTLFVHYNACHDGIWLLFTLPSPDFWVRHNDKDFCHSLNEKARNKNHNFNATIKKIILASLQTIPVKKFN